MLSRSGRRREQAHRASGPAAVAYYVLFAAWTVLCAVLYRRGSPFVRGFSVGALGGSLAGNMFTTKAVVEMLKCVAFNGDDATSLLLLYLLCLLLLL